MADLIILFYFYAVWDEKQGHGVYLVTQSEEENSKGVYVEGETNLTQKLCNNIDFNYNTDLAKGRCKFKPIPDVLVFFLHSIMLGR